MASPGLCQATRRSELRPGRPSLLFTQRVRNLLRLQLLFCLLGVGAPPATYADAIPESRPFHPQVAVFNIIDWAAPVNAPSLATPRRAAGVQRPPGSAAPRRTRSHHRSNAPCNCGCAAITLSPSGLRFPERSVIVPPDSSTIGYMGATSHMDMTGSTITSIRPLANKR